MGNVLPQTQAQPDADPRFERAAASARRVAGEPWLLACDVVAACPHLEDRDLAVLLEPYCSFLAGPHPKRLSQRERWERLDYSERLQRTLADVRRVRRLPGVQRLTYAYLKRERGRRTDERARRLLKQGYGNTPRRLAPYLGVTEQGAGKALRRLEAQGLAAHRDDGTWMALGTLPRRFLAPYSPFTTNTPSTTRPTPTVVVKPLHTPKDSPFTVEGRNTVGNGSYAAVGAKKVVGGFEGFVGHGEKQRSRRLGWDPERLEYRSEVWEAEPVTEPIPARCTYGSGSCR